MIVAGYMRHFSVENNVCLILINVYVEGKLFLGASLVVDLRFGHCYSWKVSGVLFKF